MKKLALLFFLAIPLYAQTAKVVQLPDADAIQAKALYKEKADVEAKIEALNAKIQNKVQWSFGFEYSDDFKFIVPKPYTGITGTVAGCNWNTNGYTTLSGVYNLCSCPTYGYGSIQVTGTSSNLGLISSDGLTLTSK